MYILYIVFCIQSGEHFVYKVGRGNICSFYLHKETLMGERFRREETYAYLWLIHVAVWQKPMQYCKAIILQLKISINFKRKKHRKEAPGTTLTSHLLGTGQLVKLTRGGHIPILLRKSWISGSNTREESKLSPGLYILATCCDLQFIHSLMFSFTQNCSHKFNMHL